MNIGVQPKNISALLPTDILFQTPYWSRVKSRLGWKPAAFDYRSSTGQSGDILLLTRLDTLRQSGLNMESIGTYPLVPYEERGKGKIAYLPAPRCKGLDCKAVIVVGFDDYKSLEPGWRHTFCLAVSRAREMLAVVNRSRPKTA